MGLAETAQLAVQLNLTGNFNSGLQQAERELGTFNQTATTRSGLVTGAFDRVKGAASGMGGALSHAGGQLKNLITGPLGLIGLGAGLFTLGGAIEHGIGKAVALGDEVRRLAAITGLGAQSMSLLAGTFEHFNIGADSATRLVGFLEKNVGLLAAKKDGIVKFEKEFGLALTDSNGKIKDANALILTTVDYFNNKSIPATEKAAALSKLYGRSWQELIPFLAAGRKGIADVQVELAKYGLTLKDTDIKALADFKASQRELGTALGGLELQIGLKLVPTFKKFADGLAHFIADNGPQITRFFDDLGKFAGDAAGTIAGTAHAVSGFWNAIPKEFRDLITTGLIADRTIKFLFGFDPVKAGVGLLGKGFDLFAARGSSPANPVFVSGLGGGGGVPGGGGGSGEGGIIGGIKDFVGGVLKGIVIAAPPLLIAQDTINKINNVNDPTKTDVQKTLNTSFLPFGLGPQFNLGDQLQAAADAKNRPVTPPWVGPISERIIEAKIAFERAIARNMEPLPAKISAAQRANFNALRDRIEANRIATVSGTAKVASRVDTENAAVTRAIHAQKLAVHLSVNTRVSVTDIVNGIRSHSVYSTGVKGAILGM